MSEHYCTVCGYNLERDYTQEFTPYLPAPCACQCELGSEFQSRTSGLEKTDRLIPFKVFDRDKYQVALCLVRKESDPIDKDSRAVFDVEMKGLRL